jgi:plastocyanin domain-containing protein
VKVKAGVTTRLHFVRHDKGECASVVLMPEFKINKELAPMGETVVEVTPTRSGVFPFTCGMGMLQGKIVVQD